MSLTINDRIKLRRKELNLDADYIAQKLGVSRATYYRYESKHIEKVPISILVPLSKVLKTTPEYLMGWCNDPDFISKVETKTRIEGVHVVPVYDSIPSNKLIDELIPHEQEFISEKLSELGGFFALKIKDNSMAPFIQKDDIVLSVFKNVVNNNEIAVLNIGNEDAVLRKISYTNHGIIIYGINITEHQPHFYSNSELKTTPIKVIGKVVEIRRKL